MLIQTAYLSVSRARAGAVHIPLAELETRTHELPPPHKEILLLRDSQEAYYALGWLHARGRRARLVSAVEAQGVGADADAAQDVVGEDADATNVLCVASASPPTTSFASNSAILKARYRLWEPNEWLTIVLTSPPSPLSVNGEGEPCAREASVPPSPFPKRGARGVRLEKTTVTPLLHKVGDALDLGCGSGREAVYLADMGWQVVAVDRLPEALERGRDLQRRYAPNSPPIQWICADLEKSDWRPEGQFDLITLFYFYSRELIQRACAWLEPNGSLLVEAFTMEHRARYGKPASDLRVARPGELLGLMPATMRVNHYSEAWRANGRHTARLWAERE